MKQTDVSHILGVPQVTNDAWENSIYLSTVKHLNFIEIAIETHLKVITLY